MSSREPIKNRKLEFFQKIQQDFRLNKQICIATEAAGEGINLQFCHLMVNYDLPWNPVRLEQRMGRVHRIGQEHDCHIFNFCATNTVEGQLLERLHAKLETMKTALQGRVYDVIGDLLTLNGIDFERLVKDTLLNPARIDAAKAQINRMTAEKYQEYAKRAGPANAKHNSRFLVRGGNKTTLEGDIPFERIVVSEFPDVETAKRFYNSPEYQAKAVGFLAILRTLTAVFGETPSPAVAQPLAERAAFVAMVIAVVTMVLGNTVALAQESNLWPLWLLMASPVALSYVAAVGAFQWASGRRSPPAA